MRQAASDLAWLPDEPSGGWCGHVPIWPFDRPEPRGVATLVEDQALEVRIVYGHAYPMVEPLVFPQQIDPPIAALGWMTWHLAPDGSLCMLQGDALWDPSGTVADLIPKISGWYIEYHLMCRGVVSAMTERGIATDKSLDRVLDNFRAGL